MSALGLLKKSEQAIHRLLRLGDPAGTRTPDPRLKRQLLYRLSYWVEKTTSWKRTGPHPQNANLARQAVSGAGEYGACGDDVAGMAGLEPADEGVKVPCLTTWLHPCMGERLGPEQKLRPLRLHVGWVKGLEPSTPGTTIRCSNQLSYTHHMTDVPIHLKPAGTPGGTRTPGPLLRRQLLYPPELQARITRLPKPNRSAARRVRTGEEPRRNERAFVPRRKARDIKLAATLERVMGIEPTRPAWKAGILPLNYTRMGGAPSHISLWILPHFFRPVKSKTQFCRKVLFCARRPAG